MKFECSRADFNEAVSLAGLASNARSPIKLLSNLYLGVRGGRLSVVGCDGEMWVQRTIPCSLSEEGEICLQAKTLIDVVGLLPDGQITMDVSETGSATLSEADSEYRFLVLPADDYPQIPESVPEAQLRLPMKTFREAVESVAFSVAPDLHRPVFTGIQITYDGTGLRFVASDSHRLAHRYVTGDGFGSQVEALVPERALRAILRMPLRDEEEIELQFGDGRIAAEVDGARIVCQLLRDPFINWQRVVPAEHTRVWLMETEELRSRLRRLLIIGRDNSNRVTFECRANEVTLRAKSEEKGEAKEEIQVVASGGDILTALNAKYVLDAIGPITGPGVRFELTEASRAVVIRSASEEDDGYFSLIMPMSLH